MLSPSSFGAVLPFPPPTLSRSKTEPSGKVLYGRIGHICVLCIIKRARVSHESGWETAKLGCRHLDKTKPEKLVTQKNHTHVRTSDGFSQNGYGYSYSLTLLLSYALTLVHSYTRTLSHSLTHTLSLSLCDIQLTSPDTEDGVVTQRKKLRCLHDTRKKTTERRTIVHRSLRKNKEEVTTALPCTAVIRKKKTV